MPAPDARGTCVTRPGRRAADPLQGTEVQRSRVLGQLTARAAGVTCLVAPAGYGKSTVVAQWLAAGTLRQWRQAAVRWGPREPDPLRFWEGVGQAVRAAGAVLPGEADDLLRDELRGADAAPPDAYLGRLVTALEAAPQRIVLVLDDLHTVGNPAVQEGLGRLTADLPPTVHAVLIGRSPITGVGLHRLRPTGRLRELGAADLAFDADEATALLEQVGGRPLDPDDLALLLDRTEGWVTGLRLAAHALRDAADPRAYLRGFRGHRRDVAEFLDAEVLDQLGADRRDFLGDICVLDVLTPEACDAVTGRTDSAAVLRELADEGLFVVRASGNPPRFGLQPLFRDLLLDHLHRRGDRRAELLARRASAWHARAGDAVAAVEYALQAGDAARAADLMAPLVPELHRAGRDDTLHRWFAAIPDDLLAAAPALAVKKAWICAYGGDPPAALQWCERADAATAGYGEADAEGLRAETACLRAIALRTLGDPAAALVWGATALTLLDVRDANHRADDGYARLAMVDAVAEAHAACGRPDRGADLVRAHLDRVRSAPLSFAAVGLPSTLAGLLARLGRLDEAAEYAHRALAEADRVGLTGRAPTAEAHLALAERSWEHDDLDDATTSFTRAVEASATTRGVWTRIRAMLGLARCRSAIRQFGEAEHILDAAEHVYPWGTPPDSLTAELTEYRLLTAARRGDADRARRHLHALARLPVPAPRRAYLTSLVLLTETRADEARATWHAAAPAVGVDLRATVESAVLDLRIASALRTGDRTELLFHALRAAEAGGFVRTLVGPDGGLIAGALQTLRTRDRDAGRVSPDYLLRVDAAARREQGRADDIPSRTTKEPLMEPFSDGELAVLRYLPRDLTYAEIAAERFVSVNTVKSQLKSVYRKLGVRTRAAAAERGRRLGLLP